MIGDKTLHLGPDEVSNLKLYLSMAGMWYQGVLDANASPESVRFAKEHLESIKELSRMLEDD